MKDIEKEAELFTQLLHQLGYVKVTHCRDCKFYDFGNFECRTDQTHSGTWMPESYCDRAERKEK